MTRYPIRDVIEHVVGDYHVDLAVLDGDLLGVHECQGEPAGALSEVVERSKRLDRERAECEARLREINRERRDAAREGRDLRNRLTAGVQSAFGFESSLLLQFGLKPRPEKLRRTGLTPLQKAQRAAGRAAKKAADAEAKARRANPGTTPGDLPS